MPSATSVAPAPTDEPVGAPQRLLVAWQHPHTRVISPVGVLTHESDHYTFAYLTAALDTAEFRPFLGFEDLHRRYSSELLFPLFRQRLMDHNRPDFHHYLDLLGLPEDASSLTVLGRSGGRRAGDSIFLIREPDVATDGTTHAIFFVYGARHIDGADARISSLRNGDYLWLRREPTNPANPLAVLVDSQDEQPLGWVPDLLTDYVQHVLATEPPELRVRQANGPDTPPNLRLLGELTGSIPAGHRPFEGPGWETLA